VALQEHALQDAGSCSPDRLVRELMSFIDFLQAETERLGFTLSGVAPIAPPPHLDVYQRWIEAGLHAEMGYLAAEPAYTRRAYPAVIEPNARSLLVVAMRYFSPLLAPDGPSGEALGRVAAYAWGDDYHEVIPPRLEELARILERILGHVVHSHAYADTGPILEHDFAQTAGLGWTGKNTCLISPRKGSFFLLGETFLDVEIEPSQPMRTDHCGACRRCIEACPTEAIREDRTINSVRCISYQTIENKGAIPPELRSKMGDWVFGCDICQMVCPWNLRFSTLEGQPALAPRPEVPHPVLRSELAMSPQQFNLKFRRSPIRRAKRRGYLRNVAVALGNHRDPATIPNLAQALHNEPEPLVRGHAAWALGRFQQPAARNALDRALDQETDAGVVSEIRSALDS
jgi:epoxyqueuosine reductase